MADASTRDGKPVQPAHRGAGSTPWAPTSPAVVKWAAGGRVWGGLPGHPGGAPSAVCLRKSQPLRVGRPLFAIGGIGGRPDLEQVSRRVFHRLCGCPGPWGVASG